MRTYQREKMRQLVKLHRPMTQKGARISGCYGRKPTARSAIMSHNGIEVALP